MRNYFKSLRLSTTAPREEVAQALNMATSTDRTLTSRISADAHDILLDEDRRRCYADVVELYESMHIAIDCLEGPVGKDTHRWQARLSEFDTTTHDNAGMHSPQDGDASA